MRMDGTAMMPGSITGIIGRCPGTATPTKSHVAFWSQTLVRFSVFLLLVVFGLAVSCTGSTSRRGSTVETHPAAEAKTASAQGATDEAGFVAVVAVVDGDTIKVAVAGGTETVRVVGIDTPEVVDPRKPVQCFGREASAKAKELLAGQQVRLEADPTQSDRDKYGRALRYVERVDRTDFGLFLISNGYAHEYTYDVPYQRQAPYQAAQKKAREQGLGLWAPTACNGDTKRPAG